ncbi:S8 family serine peptidase [Aliidiomarina halalkaliphila]|uniref:S8 family serine peptidase n=1 Tax=Aliidiomarina halalkaliphila TaxID=2593535 RepID=A0A552X5I8_9GAMM|nr:S8 family serine peptidase [Aliidiomarina halalkaliphila]TRW49853.1 S8 family serine peptidase [Aliidiomarina halalkaliphila]
MKRTTSTSLKLASVAAATLFALGAQATSIGPQVQSILDANQLDGTVELVVSFDGDGPLTRDQVLALENLGVTGTTFSQLPIAGVVASLPQIQAITALPDVRSVYLNKQMTYENAEETELTGVNRVRTDRDLRVNGFPVTGRGVGVVVNDSGIDGLHRDVEYPTRTIQNVAAAINLNSFSPLLPITYQENLVTTDQLGGHGTHVAATVGGDGVMSGGLYEGVAPGANLIGYGSGAALFLLDTLGGFDYALANQTRYDIRVITNSFGSTGDTGTDFDPNHPTNIATKKLADRGVIVVFSAGNSGSGAGTITGNFKKAPWVITVAAGDAQGNLASFSSRGERGRGGDVTINGETFTWEDRPTVTAPGVGVISARVQSDPLGGLSATSDAERIEVGHLPYYTAKSGTSMAAPHVAGIVALMLEVNPSLEWREVKAILQHTATNMPGRDDWEVGAGYVNAYEAVKMAASLAVDPSGLNNLDRDFNASATIEVGAEDTITAFFSPVGEPERYSFQVGSDITLVSASANVAENTVAIVLTDPNGNRYGSGVSLPVLGQNIAATAPGVAGEWTLEIRGVGGLSGVALDPLGVTNGYGVPGDINVRVVQERAGDFSGLDDIDQHPAQGFIEYAVQNRLVDGLGNTFNPNRELRRIELADFQVMGGGIRQFLPSAARFTDVSGFSALLAEATTARGAALKDRAQFEPGVIRASGSKFNPNGRVTKAELAYTLIQSMGLGVQVADFDGEVVAYFNGQAVPVTDANLIPSELRGYVQASIEAGVLPVRFHIQQGLLDLEPTITATFEPSKRMTRGDYAVAATRLHKAFY